MTTQQEREGSSAGNYFDLYRATLKGDWKRAEAIFDQDESALTAKINPFGYNALQIAVELGHATFAVNTINRMPLEALKDGTNSGNTALNVAARSDCINAARALVQRDPDLTQTRCNGDRAPILEAAINGSKAVLQFLCSATRDENPSPFRGNDGAWVLYNAIANGLFVYWMSGRRIGASARPED
ncbi:hypothetical protein RJ641_025852 [Dillenia turbinata]|uniref:Ankyrin repeat domain-containing protein n=1 Tax=Dillenia turbinata TaxID=194707 RepID=A0AAN8W2C7_9MAGN